MLKILKFLAGVALLPLCVVATQTVWSLLRAIQPTHVLLPPAGMAVVGGFLLWVVLFFVLPKPFRTYILAHELTHALWGWAMGASIGRIRVGRERGSVELSKTNFLITLAPYFFPFYTMLVVVGYALASLFHDMQPHYLWWLAAVGLTWGFHFTFTVTVLTQHQSDIRAHGHVFSYVVIYLMNVLGIVLWTVLVSAVTLGDAVALFMHHHAAMQDRLWPIVARTIGRIGVQ